MRFQPTAQKEDLHAHYVAVIDQMRAEADKQLGAEKQIRIGEGRLMPRKAMEEYEKAGPIL